MKNQDLQQLINGKKEVSVNSIKKIEELGYSFAHFADNLCGDGWEGLAPMGSVDIEGDKDFFKGDGIYGEGDEKCKNAIFVVKNIFQPNEEILSRVIF